MNETSVVAVIAVCLLTATLLVAILKLAGIALKLSDIVDRAVDLSPPRCPEDFKSLAEKPANVEKCEKRSDAQELNEQEEGCPNCGIELTTDAVVEVSNSSVRIRCGQCQWNGTIPIDKFLKHTTGQGRQYPPEET